jgi:non-specific serine/threonine protein kinase
MTELGRAAFADGDAAAARALYRQSLPLHRRVDDWLGLVRAFEGCAELAAPDAPEQALRLAGAASALRAAMRLPALPFEMALLDLWLEAARGAVGIDAASEAWAAGEALSLDESVAEALVIVAEPDVAPVLPTALPLDGSSPAQPVTPPLTPREGEVTALIARGLTNREIAAALVITERTAKTHVEHILNKLGLRNRAQITAWSTEHDLGRRKAPA